VRLMSNKITGHLEVKIANSNAISFEEGLAEVFGFDTIAVGLAKGSKPANLYIQVPQQLFVYSDILEPQIVGDTIAPLLRIVGIEDVSLYGKIIVKTYDNPHYVPILKRRFETVEIEIRDSEGKPAPFEYGPVVLKLHFRQT
jgi:hypothetical protein